MAVALVQTVRLVDHTGAANPVSQAFTVVNNAALIVAVVAQFDPGSGNPKCTVTCDGAAMTLDRAQPALATSTEDHRVSIFSLPNIASGSRPIAVSRFLGDGTTAATTNFVLYILEISGAATSSHTDGAGSGATATGANPASGNFTASVSDGAWIAAFVNENASADATIAAGSGWTMDTTNGRNTAGSPDCISGIETRMNPGSTGAFNGNFTAASARYSAQEFVYKAAAGGGGGRTTRNTRASNLGMELGMDMWGDI